MRQVSTPQSGIIQRNVHFQCGLQPCPLIPIEMVMPFSFGFDEYVGTVAPAKDEIAQLPEYNAGPPAEFRASMLAAVKRK
jgi:hypothetical protein